MIVNSINISTALKSALVTSIYDGTLAVRLRSNGEPPGGQGRRGSVQPSCSAALAMGCSCTQRLLPPSSRLLGSTSLVSCSSLTLLTLPAGLAVTQAAALSVYAGTASPPSDITPLSPSPSPSPWPTANNSTQPASTDEGMPIAEIAGIAGGTGGAVILTGAVIGLGSRGMWELQLNWCAWLARLDGGAGV